jgi:hypothetical protein
MFVIKDHDYRFYEGEKANGQPLGRGFLLYEGGYRFDGNWVGGELQAEGLITFKNLAARAVTFEPKFFVDERRGFFKGDYDFAHAQWIGVDDWIGKGPSQDKLQSSIQNRVQRIRRTFERMRCVFGEHFDTGAKYEPLSFAQLPDDFHCYPFDLQYYLTVLGPTEVGSSGTALLQVVCPVPVRDVVVDSHRYLSGGIHVDSIEESRFDQLLCAEWPSHHEIIGLDLCGGTYSATTLFGDYMNEGHKGFLTFIEDILQGDHMVGPLFDLG